MGGKLSIPNRHCVVRIAHNDVRLAVDQRSGEICCTEVIRSWTIYAEKRKVSGCSLLSSRFGLAREPGERDIVERARPLAPPADHSIYFMTNPLQRPVPSQGVEQKSSFLLYVEVRLLHYMV